MTKKIYIDIIDSERIDISSGYSPTKSTFSPYYFKTALLAYASATEVSSTNLFIQ